MSTRVSCCHGRTYHTTLSNMCLPILILDIIIQFLCVFTLSLMLMLAYSMFWMSSRKRKEATLHSLEFFLCFVLSLCKYGVRDNGVILFITVAICYLILHAYISFCNSLSSQFLLLVLSIPVIFNSHCFLPFPSSFFCPFLSVHYYHVQSSVTLVLLKKVISMLCFFILFVLPVK
jgi:hypothetical protein